MVAATGAAGGLPPPPPLARTGPAALGAGFGEGHMASVSGSMAATMDRAAAQAAVQRSNAQAASTRFTGGGFNVQM